jgi:hypothetical protein
LQFSHSTQLDPHIAKDPGALPNTTSQEFVACENIIELNDVDKFLTVPGQICAQIKNNSEK